jgi:hypothetical protein
MVAPPLCQPGHDTTGGANSTVARIIIRWPINKQAAEKADEETEGMKEKAKANE